MQPTRSYEPFKFLSRLFFIPLRVEPGVWPVTRTYSHEVDNQYRVGPTVVVRLPFHWGIGIGWWMDTDIDGSEQWRLEQEARAQEQAAYDAFTAVNGPVDPVTWTKVRKLVAAQGLDWDEELLVMQQLGVFEGGSVE